MQAEYNPATGMVVVTLTYAEARAAVDAGENILAAIGPILAGISPPVPKAEAVGCINPKAREAGWGVAFCQCPPCLAARGTRIVSIPRKRRQYAEPAPEAEARARREAIGGGK